FVHCSCILRPLLLYPSSIAPVSFVHQGCNILIINGFTSRKTLKILKALKTTICARGSTRRRFFKIMNLILKFFQVDITGMFRMTSSARYFKEGVGSSRPSWRWLICFVEHPKANTSCRALVKRCRRLWGASEDTKSSMTSTRHSTCTFALRLPTVYAGRLFL